METTTTQTVGATVARDYRTASVFQKYGIDFCCKGGLTIAEACNKKGISQEEIVAEITATTASASSPGSDFNNWPLDQLVDYIVQKHHGYVTEQTPVLLQFLDKLCRVHGQRHPELFEIQQEFAHVAEELAMHMKKEELILFPAIKKLVKAKSGEVNYNSPAFGTVQQPINMMLHEHNVEGERFEKIATLTDGYTAPADGCTTYRVAFQMLKDFETDLHIHIHLENNIVFPKAVELETALTA